MVSPLAVHMFLPALPFLRRDFGISVATTQWAVTSSMLAFACGMMIFGPISDRYGRRKPLLIGLFLYFIGSIVGALSIGMGGLILGRVVQAFGSASGFVLARAIVSDLYKEEDVAATLAYITMAIIVVPAIAPFIGGLIVDSFRWRGIFWALAGISAIAIIVCWLFIPETHKPEQSDRSSPDLLVLVVKLFKHPAFVGFTLQSSGAFAAFHCLLATMPYIMIEHLGRPATEYGIWFLVLALSYIIGNFTATRLPRNLKTHEIAYVGTILATLSILTIDILVWSGYVTPAVIFVPSMVFIYATGIFNPNVQAGVLAITSSHRGTVSSLFSFTKFVIAAAAIQIVGQFQNSSPHPMLIGMTIAIVCSLLSIIIMNKQSGQFGFDRD